MRRIFQSVLASRARMLAAAVLCLLALVVAFVTWWPGAPAPAPTGGSAAVPAVGLARPSPEPLPGPPVPAREPAGESAGSAGPQARSAPVAPPEARGTVRLSVRSILVGDDRRLALVDGRIVGPGDRVGGAVVMDIGPRTVDVREAGGGRRRLELARPAPGAEVR